MMDQAHLGPGVHDISAEAYHADPCATPSLSSTLAKTLLAQSPLHAWTASPRLNPAWEPKDSKVFDIGRAAHRAILGKGGDYVAYPTDMLASNGAASTKEAKAWADEQRAAGRTPLKADDVDRIGVMAEVVRRKLEGMGMAFDPARSELSAISEIDGVLCRAMIDSAPVGKSYLIDLKTTDDASPEAVIRSVMSYSYDVQAAHYLDVWHAATGERRKMRFVFIEKSAPFEVSVVELHDDADSEADWMLTARSKAGEARRIWGECLAASIWPGYPSKIAVIGAPSYHNQKWADREVGSPVVTKEMIARASAWQSPKGL